MPDSIVAIADRDTESPTALGFSQNGVPMFKEALDVVSLGDKVDNIFDITHDPRLHQALRTNLLESKKNIPLSPPRYLPDSFGVSLTKKPNLSPAPRVIDSVRQPLSDGHPPTNWWMTLKPSLLFLTYSLFPLALLPALQ